MKRIRKYFQNSAKVSCAFIFFFALTLGGCVTNLKNVSAVNKDEAKFLFRFTQFVEWPPTAFSSANSPLVIGVLGGNPFGDELEKAVQGQRINCHPVVVRRMTPISDLKQCHVLFINRGIRSRLPLIFDSLGNGHTLTVSDADNFLAAGGAINFFTVENKVRFEINRAAAEKAGLKMNSQLLMMAKRPPVGQ